MKVYLEYTKLNYKKKPIHFDINLNIYLCLFVGDIFFQN